MDRNEISEVTRSFELLEVWFLNFSLKEATMKNIYNRNVAELALHNSLLKAGIRHMIFR